MIIHPVIETPTSMYKFPEDGNDPIKSIPYTLKKVIVLGLGLMASCFAL